MLALRRQACDAEALPLRPIAARLYARAASVLEMHTPNASCGAGSGSSEFLTALGEHEREEMRFSLQLRNAHSSCDAIVPQHISKSTSNAR